MTIGCSPCPVCVKPEDGFHIDLDDFLMGLLTMANELVRIHVAYDHMFYKESPLFSQ